MERSVQEFDALKSVRVIDPRIARESQVVQIVNDGPSSTTFQTVSPPDPTSQSPSFVIQTPSPMAGINRNMRLRAAGFLTITGTNLAPFASAANDFAALRQFPLQSCMQSLTVQINDWTASLGSLFQYIAPLANTSNASISMGQSQSTFPAQPDRFATYAGEAASPGGAFASVANLPYGDGIAGGRINQIVRGEVNAGGTVMVISFDISEDLVISPFTYDNNDKKALYGISTLTINVNYGNFHRMLSLAVGGATAAATFSSVTCNFLKQDLAVTYVVAHDSSLIEIPRKHIYEYSSVQAYTTQGTAFSTYVGALTPPSQSVFSNAIEFAVVPQKLIVFGTYSLLDLQDPTKSLPDLYFPISGVSITFGTRAGLLSGASSVNLWEIYRRNGGKLPFPIWNGNNLPQYTLAPAPATLTSNFCYSGGPLILDTAADLSLPDGVVPGMSQRIQFSINCTLTNKTQVDYSASGIRLVVIAITPGMIAIKDGASMGTLGGITTADAMTSEIAGLETTELLDADKATSGWSGGSVVAGRLKAHQFQKKAGALIGGVNMGGVNMGGVGIGGALIGGRKMAASQLRKF